MISIVNRTVFTTSSFSTPQSATIPATTSGNTLLVVMMVSGFQAASIPHLVSGTFGGNVGYYGGNMTLISNVPGGQTTVTWQVGQTVSSSAVIYELSPCTINTSAEAHPTAGLSETGATLTPSAPPSHYNAAYFEVITQLSANSTPGSYNSINSPWTLDYNVSPLTQPNTPPGMGSVAYILNSTGSQTPTWSVTNGGTYCGMGGILFLDNNYVPVFIPPQTSMNAF